MELGVLGARGAVDVAGGKEAVAGDELVAAAATAGPAGLALQIAERLAGNRVVAGQHRDELIRLDLAIKTEVLGGVAEPIALGLTSPE